MENTTDRLNVAGQVCEVVLNLRARFIRKHWWIGNIIIHYLVLRPVISTFRAVNTVTLWVIWVDKWRGLILKLTTQLTNLTDIVTLVTFEVVTSYLELSDSYIYCQRKNNMQRLLFETLYPDIYRKSQKY